MNLYYESNSLQHHGIKGMRWGVRRFQKKDGSLTPAGEKRYSPKTIAEKKEIESFKAQRSARRLNTLSELHRMVLNSRSTPNLKKQSAGQLNLERQKLLKDAMETAASNRLAKQKLKLEKQQIKDKRDLEERAQKQQAIDSKRQYKLDKKKLDLDREEMRLQNKGGDQDGYYELPDTYERQQSSMSNGKKLALGALGVVGTVAVGVAAAKYGPGLLNKIKESGLFNKTKDAGEKAADTASKLKDLYDNGGKEVLDGVVLPKLTGSSSNSGTSSRSSNIYDTDWRDVTPSFSKSSSSSTAKIASGPDIPRLTAPKSGSGANSRPNNPGPDIPRLSGSSSSSSSSGSKSSSRPSFSDRLKTAVSNAQARNADRRNERNAMKIFRESSKYQGINYDPDTPIAGNIGGKSKQTVFDEIDNVLNSIGNIRVKNKK